MEFILRVDARGCIVIPPEARKRLGIESVVRLRVEDDRIVIERVRDPIEFLEVSTVSGTNDVEMEMPMIRKSIDEELCRGA